MGRLSLSSRLQTILQPRMKFGLPPAPAPAPHLAAKFYHGTVSIGSSVAGDPLTFVCLRIMDYVSHCIQPLTPILRTTISATSGFDLPMRSGGMDGGYCMYSLQFLHTNYILLVRKVAVVYVCMYISFSGHHWHFQYRFI
jgi:hypothetical protein